MRIVILVAILFSLRAAEFKPGLLVKATDGELTVYFVALSPNIILDPADSIHPQLKSAFRAEFSGVLTLENPTAYSFSSAPPILIDGKDCAGKSITLPAGQLSIHFSVARGPSDNFQIHLPFPASALGHRDEPRQLREDQSRELGRRLFEDFNCAACHRDGPLPYRFTPLPEPPKAKPMRALYPTQGCLSDTPDDGAQKFDLTASDREALQLFLQTPDISLAPLIDFPRRLQQLKCAECHSNFHDFGIQSFESALLDHPGLNIAPSDIAELSYSFAKLAAP